MKASHLNTKGYLGCKNSHFFSILFSALMLVVANYDSYEDVSFQLAENSILNALSNTIS